ncbi:hypothetical protein [Streptomyces avicenniae]|uniref:hypothetical protein n=1 Tax=Streptomyces avicenniae TaxID=500153 RepID=UPI00069BA298|nr:hypothetical protein [Streptomyces avicenniae]
MQRDSALTGHWTSGPFDYGAMESSDLVFLPGGDGWTEYASVSGLLSVTRFRWGCPRPGVLELRMTRIVEGTWGAVPGFATVESDEPYEETLRTAYAFDAARGSGGEVVAAVRFEVMVEYCQVYARGGRHVLPEADPSRSLL